MRVIFGMLEHEEFVLVEFVVVVLVDVLPFAAVLHAHDLQVGFRHVVEFFL